MYNRYLDSAPTDPDAHISAPQPGPTPQKQTPSDQTSTQAPGSLLGGITSGLGETLGGIFQNISLEHFDSGDILLILIILFLVLEGDNLEIVITLGLMLLLGLDGD